MNEKAKKVTIRNWRKEDIRSIVECQVASYPDYSISSLCNERHYKMQFKAFPEGQFLAEFNGRVVGYATSLIVQLDDDTEFYKYPEITGLSTFSTHNPSGDTLYGADIAVHPDFRGRGISTLLYEKRKALMKKYNLRRMIAYGRLPGYREFAGKMTPNGYVEKVKGGELKDFALNAHLKAGFEVKRVLLDFLRDEASLNHSTFLEMKNPDYNQTKRKIAAEPIKRPIRKIRVCSAQYLMRPISSWGEFENIAEFFVDTANEYYCHFLLLPELFTAHLFKLMKPDLDFGKAIKRLEKYGDKYRKLFSDLAKKYALYIIAGSHPVLRKGELYNTAHFFTPKGNIYTQDKLHVTPTEYDEWKIRPGDSLNIFSTPFGRIAIQICYDIEFPEISRVLSLSGVELIFVPFSTDEKKSYHRVRYCSHARAVENYIYVVISGIVGNLPTIKNYLLNYGQSAILTPSDFSFPLEAIAGEAEPNVETVVIADLDLKTLEQQRELGTVRPFYDRRPDLYDLRLKIPINIIQVD